MPIVTEDSQPKRRRAPWWVFAVATLGLVMCSCVALLPSQNQMGNVGFYSGPDDYDIDIRGPVEVVTQRDSFYVRLRILGWAHLVMVYRVNIVHGMVITPIREPE